MASNSDAQRAAWAFIAIITLWRVAMLWANRTDLFVDEAQYWAWGQHLDWGYFSKPPLIGWLIRAVTDVLGSDTAPVVRLAAPLLHAATALIVIWAARAFVDGWVAAWAGAIYVAMPLITVGSSLISTDTVMLPFFALALGLYGRLIEAPSAARAVALGLAVGAGMMAKYAMVYFLLCAALVWLLQPAQRIRLRDAALAGIAALCVFAPNIWWNLANDGQTVRHLVEDNARLGDIEFNWDEALFFLLEQSIALGPILFLALLWPLFRRRGALRGPELTLILFSLPIIAIVTGQALMSRAFGNWAATAYIAAPMLAASVLQFRRPLLMISQALNVSIALALPLILAFPFALGGGGSGLANRYLGLHIVSEIAAERAREAGITSLFARERALLADLFYTLDGQGFTIYAWDPNRGGQISVDNWYEAAFPAPDPLPIDSVYLGGKRPPCTEAELLSEIETETGYWAGRDLRLWLLPAGC